MIGLEPLRRDGRGDSLEADPGDGEGAREINLEIVHVPESGNSVGAVVPRAAHGAMLHRAAGHLGRLHGQIGRRV